jgi:hypothetical protein
MKTTPSQDRSSRALIETVKECFCLDHARTLSPTQEPHSSGAGLILTLTINPEKKLKYWILRNGEIKTTVLQYNDKHTQEETHKITL